MSVEDKSVCPEGLDEIADIIKGHHGKGANIAIVVDDGTPGARITVYTITCCPAHKRELYEQAIESLEEQLEKLDRAAKADTMPPKDEMH